MIIPQIRHLLHRQAQPPIPLAPLPPAILGPQPEKEDGTTRPAQPQHPQRHAEPDGIRGRLGGDEDVAGDDAAGVAEADLQGGGDGALVVAGDVVGEPGEGDGLGDVGAGGDEVEGGVAGGDGDGALGREQQGVAGGGDEQAGEREGVAVAERVGEERREQRGHGRDDVDGDGEHLGAHRGPAELFEDRRREERGRVAGVDDAEVH